MDVKDISNYTEKEYRDIKLDSYSSFKDFIKSFKLYYKKYILKEVINEKNSQDSEDLRFGSLVDLIKFQPNSFEDYYIVTTASVPTGQLLDFTNNLYKLVLANSNEEGVLCNTLENLMDESYIITNIKRDKLDTVKTKFISDALPYFEELRSRGSKTVVSSKEVDWANSLVDYINNHPYTRHIFQKINTEKLEIINQYKIIGEIQGIKVKGMLDRMEINHIDKIINLYDLKVMSNNMMFHYNYLKLYYYIQNAVYTTLIKLQFPDYEVHPIKFIAVDKYKNYDPIIVNTTEKQYQEALNGFTTSYGRKYPGLLETIEDLEWHKTNDIWTSSKTVFINKGIIDLETSNIEYESES